VPDKEFPKYKIIKQVDWQSPLEQFRQGLFAPMTNSTVFIAIQKFAIRLIAKSSFCPRNPP